MGREIFDDAAEFNGQPGQLLQIDQINRASRVIKLVTAPVPLSTTGNGVNPNRHPKLRRWDSIKELPVQVPATNEGFISLENGVEIRFGAGSYSTGDHWLIPARTAISSETGTIDWPFTTPQPRAEYVITIVGWHCSVAIPPTTLLRARIAGSFFDR